MQYLPYILKVNKREIELLYNIFSQIHIDDFTSNKEIFRRYKAYLTSFANLAKSNFDENGYKSMYIDVVNFREMKNEIDKYVKIESYKELCAKFDNIEDSAVRILKENYNKVINELLHTKQ